MATYTTDFSPYAADAVPSDWTVRWVTANSTFAVRAKAEAQGGKTLEHSSTVDGRRLITVDTVDTETDRDNVEILAHVRNNGSVASNALDQVYLHARASGAAAAESSYWLRFSSTSGGGIQLGKYVAGASSNLGSTFSGFTWVTATWYWLKFRVDGSNLYGKIWEDGENEPSDWQVAATDTAIAAAGWVGFGNLETNGTSRDLDWIKVVTGGGTATLEEDITVQVNAYQAKMLVMQSETPEFRLYQGKMLVMQSENPEAQVYQMKMLVAIPFGYVAGGSQQPRMVLAF